MKTTILLVKIVLASYSFGQITTESIKEKFEISNNDHRTIEFIQANEACTESYSNVSNAIESVFNSLEMTDYKKVCIESTSEQYFNKPLSINELVEIYVKLETEKK